MPELFTSLILTESVCVCVCARGWALLRWWVFFIRLMNNTSELSKEYQARGEEEEKGWGRRGEG